MSTATSLDILVDVRARLDDLVKAQGEIKRLRAEVTTTAGTVKNGFSGLFGNFFGAGLAVNAVTRSISAGLQLVTGSLREANSNFENSRNLEISVAGYNKLRAVIRASGGDIGAMDMAIERLNQSLADARDGDESKVNAFRNLGIDPIALEAMQPEDRFVRLARAVNASSDRLKAWRDLGDIIGDKTIRNLREGLNQLAEDGFASVAGVATDAEAKGTSAIHAFFESIEQNKALFKSKIVEDFGGALSVLGYGAGVATEAPPITPADIGRLRTIQQQRDALRALQLDLKNVGKANEAVLSDPSMTEGDRKFWANDAASRVIKLLMLLKELRRAMPLDKQSQAERDAELQGYDYEIKATVNSVRTGPSAMARIKDRFENYNQAPTSYSAGNPDYLAPKQGIKAGAMEWVTGLGSQGQQVSAALQSTLGATVSGISDGIYGWITGTKSFGEAMMQLGATVFRTVIETIVQMGVQWAVTQALIKTGMVTTHAVGEGLRGARIAGAATEGAATTAALAPAAATASISSFGLAAILGIAALVAAMAAFGGFAEGGVVRGPGTGTSDSIFARLSNGEGVLTARTVERIGPGAVDALNAGMPVATALGAAPVAFGGNAAAVAGGGSRESGRNLHVYLDRSAWLDAVQNDLSGIAHAVYDKRARA